jgi:hypothetical protein
MRQRRKNFFPTLVLIFVLWGFLGAMIGYVEPELVKDILIKGAYLPFFLLFFPTVLFTAAVIWGNSRRGLLTAICVTLFLLLRLYGLGNVLNLLLILGIAITVDRYFA